MDEFEWERELRESDRRTDKLMEIMEKYRGHPDSEKLVARDMGWKWVEETIEARERGALPEPEPIDPASLPPLELDPRTEGKDWILNDEGDPEHPLCVRSYKQTMEFWHWCKDAGLLDDDGDSVLNNMLFEVHMCNAKMAGALNGLGYEDDPDCGLIVASLKRGLGHLHKALARSDELAASPFPDRDRLAAFRERLLGVREDILALMQEYRDRLRGDG